MDPGHSVILVCLISRIVREFNVLNCNLRINCSLLILMDTYISCVPSSSSVRWVHVDYKKGKGPEPRYDHAACASNDSNVLYIYGGVSGDGDNCFNDVWSFEIGTCRSRMF